MLLSFVSHCNRHFCRWQYRLAFVKVHMIKWTGNTLRLGLVLDSLVPFINSWMKFWIMMLRASWLKWKIKNQKGQNFEVFKLGFGFLGKAFWKWAITINESIHPHRCYLLLSHKHVDPMFVGAIGLWEDSSME